MNQWKKVWRLRLISPIWDMLMTSWFVVALQQIFNSSFKTLSTPTNWLLRVKKWPSYLWFPFLPLSVPQQLSVISAENVLCICPLHFFLPLDGTMPSILKALGMFRFVFFVLFYTMRIFIINECAPVPRSTNVNDMCWTNSLKYYASKMKK